ncbi:hypothetical protein CHS0354_006799 [Potamilus streckersoni]|uniref:Gustatory receptor n=1 Tax=Potamilus streckersoni TaxID=2493646 RepID=A0AAE0S992_9BIVA|nr:hypothetical protein CHS0354_006799 [Potamilus streckersoni]
MEEGRAKEIALKVGKNVIQAGKNKIWPTEGKKSVKSQQFPRLDEDNLSELDVTNNDDSKSIQKKTIGSSENEKGSIHNVYKPIEYVLRFCGIYLFEKMKTTTHCLHTLYCACVLILQWFDVVRMLVSVFIETVSSGSFVSIFTFVIHFMSTLYTITVALFVFRTHHQNLITLLNEYFKKHATNVNFKKTAKRMTVVMTILVIVTLSIVILGIVVSLTNLLPDAAAFTKQFVPNGLYVQTGTVGYVILIILIGFARALSTLGTFTIYIYYYLTIFIFWKEYQDIQRQVEGSLKHGNDDVSKLEENLEGLRIRHDDLSRIIIKFNDILVHFISIIYMSASPTSAFLIYGLFNGQLNVGDASVFIWSLTTNNLQMVIMTIVGAILNAKAHEPMYHLHRIQILKISDKTFQSVSLFLWRLQGPPIGISVWRLFVISKKTILVILLAVMAYTAIVSSSVK